MNINGIKFRNFEFEEVEWTLDCCGKQDFDFPVAYVETRYWPDHTAKPSIFLGNKVIAELPDGKYITGETEKECKDNVEQWIKQELCKIIDKIIG